MDTGKVCSGGSLQVGCGIAWGHQTSLAHRLLDLSISSLLRERLVWGGQEDSPG